MERYKVPGSGLVSIFSTQKGLKFSHTPIDDIEDLDSIELIGNEERVKFFVLSAGKVEVTKKFVVFGSGGISEYRFIPDPLNSSRGKRLSSSGETNKKTCKDSVAHCSYPTILILFIKADAISLIDTIKNKKALYEGAESTLFIDAFKMWVGTEEQYKRDNVIKEFNREESKDSFVKEYDYVAMRFMLGKAYKGYSKGEDSYERNQFFTDICKDKVQLMECSKRLSFDECTKTDAYDVY